MIKSKIRNKIMCVLLALTLSGGVFSFVGNNAGGATLGAETKVEVARAEEIKDFDRNTVSLKFDGLKRELEGYKWSILTQSEKDYIRMTIDLARGNVASWLEYYSENVRIGMYYYDCVYKHTISADPRHTPEALNVYASIKPDFDKSMNDYYLSGHKVGLTNAYNSANDAKIWKKMRDIYDDAVQKNTNLDSVDDIVEYYETVRDRVSRFKSEQIGDVKNAYDDAIEFISEAGCSYTNKYTDGPQAFRTERLALEKKIAGYEVANMYDETKAEGNFRSVLDFKRDEYVGEIGRKSASQFNEIASVKAEAKAMLDKLKEYYAGSDTVVKGIEDKFKQTTDDQNAYAEMKAEFDAACKNFVAKVVKTLDNNVAIAEIERTIAANAQVKTEAEEWYNKATEFYTKRNEYIDGINELKQEIESSYENGEISQEDLAKLTGSDQGDCTKAESALRNITYAKAAEFPENNMVVLGEKIQAKFEVCKAHYKYVNVDGKVSLGDRKTECDNKKKAALDDIEKVGASAVGASGKIADRFLNELTEVTKTIREEKLGKIEEYRTLITDGMVGEKKAEINGKIDGLKSGVEAAATPDEIDGQYKAVEPKLESAKQLSGYYVELMGGEGFTDEESSKIGEYKGEDLLIILSEEDDDGVTTILNNVKKKVGIFVQMRDKYDEFLKQKSFLKREEENTVKAAKLGWLEEIMRAESNDYANDICILARDKVDKILSFKESFDALNQESVFSSTEKSAVASIRLEAIKRMCEATNENIYISHAIETNRISGLIGIIEKYGELNEYADFTAEDVATVTEFRKDAIEDIAEADTLEKIAGRVEAINGNAANVMKLATVFNSALEQNNFSEEEKAKLDTYRNEDIKKLCSAEVLSDNRKIYSLSEGLVKRVVELNKAYAPLKVEDFDAVEARSIEKFLINDIEKVRSAQSDSEQSSYAKVGAVRAETILKLFNSYNATINEFKYFDRDLNKIEESYKAGVLKIGSAESIDTIEKIEAESKAGMKKMPIFAFVLIISGSAVVILVFVIFMIIFNKCKIIYRLPDKKKTVFAVKHSFPGKKVAIADIPERRNKDFDRKTGKLVCENGVFELEGVYRDRILTKRAKKTLKMKMKTRNYYLKFVKVEDPKGGAANIRKKEGGKKPEYKKPNTGLPPRSTPNRANPMQPNKRNGR